MARACWVGKDIPGLEANTVAIGEPALRAETRTVSVSSIVRVFPERASRTLNECRPSAVTPQDKAGMAVGDTLQQPYGQ